MAQVVRGNRLPVYQVVAIIGATFPLGALLLLLLVPSIRAAVFSFVLCISVVFAIVYMAKGGSFGTQVFALLTIVVVVVLTFPTIITPQSGIAFHKSQGGSRLLRGCGAPDVCPCLMVPFASAGVHSLSSSTTRTTPN